MGKVILSAYAGVTALQIKNKAEIPIQQYMTVVGNNVECDHIPISVIKNILGSGATSVINLCREANVNPYSYFSPKTWAMGVNGLEPVFRTPSTLSYFAGYNHDAPAPGISVDDVSAVDSTHSFNFYCFVSFGEYDFRDVSGATEVVCKVYDGASNIATFWQDISGDVNYLEGVVFSSAISNPSNHTNFSVQVYFAGAGHVKICDIPNIGPTNFTVTITQSGGGSNGIFTGVSLSADWEYSDYPTAMLVADDTACSVNSVLDTFTVKIRGIDTDGDGIGDMTGITLGLYARKNANPTLYYCGMIQPSRANQVGPSGSLPFTIEANDSVDFVIAAP